MLESLKLVRSAGTPEQFWVAQKHLLDCIKREEGFITKRRRQVKALNKAKWAFTRLAKKSIDRIHRYDAVIQAIENSGFHHQRVRNVYRYFGDTLACKLLPKHHIKVMMNNHDPGLMLGKTGQKLEVDIAESVANDGFYVILHDLTHCLRMGDVTIKHPEREFLIMECKTGSKKEGAEESGREARQSAKLKILEELFMTDQVKLNKDKWNDLARFRMPSGYVEYASEEKYLTADFIKACQLGNEDFQIVRPEPGLVYIVKRPHINPGDWMPHIVPDMVEAGGMFSFSALVGRVDGKNAYVAPLTLLDIPDTMLVDILLGNLVFTVLINLRLVVDEFAKRGIEATPRLDEMSNLGGFELRDPDGSFYHASDDLLISMMGPRMIHEVQYGLSSLTAAISNMLGTLDIIRDFAPPDPDIEPGTPILTRCLLCDSVHEVVWGEEGKHECQNEA